MCAIVFLLMAIFSQKLGSTTDSQSQTVTEENLKLLESAVEENKFTEASGILHLNTQGMANSMFIVSQVHYGFSNFFWGVFAICLICGFIEPRAEKKK